MSYERIRYFRSIPLNTMIPIPVGLDAATTAWVAAVVGDGGSVSEARQVLVNSLIVGLRSAGVFTKLDRLWIFAAENTQSALRDLVNTAQASTAVAAPTFTVDRGYQGNGTTQFVDTQFTPPGTFHLQNSASWGVWVRINSAASMRHGWINAGPTKGTYGTNDDIGTPDLVVGGINITFDNTDVATAAGTKFVSSNRSGAATTQLYADGVSVDTGTIASQDFTGAVSFWCCARNFGGGFNAGGTAQVSCTYMGGSLNSTEQASLYTQLQTYMTAVGA